MFTRFSDFFYCTRPQMTFGLYQFQRILYASMRIYISMNCNQTALFYHVYNFTVFSDFNLSTSTDLCPLPISTEFLYSPSRIYIPSMWFNQDVLIGRCHTRTHTLAHAHYHHHIDYYHILFLSRTV